jgi:hypothetical protein
MGRKHVAKEQAFRSIRNLFGPKTEGHRWRTLLSNQGPILDVVNNGSPLEGAGKGAREPRIPARVEQHEQFALVKCGLATYHFESKTLQKTRIEGTSF